MSTSQFTGHGDGGGNAADTLAGRPEYAGVASDHDKVGQDIKGDVGDLNAGPQGTTLEFA